MKDFFFPLISALESEFECEMVLYTRRDKEIVRPIKPFMCPSDRQIRPS